MSDWGSIYCSTDWGFDPRITARSIYNEGTPDCFQIAEFVTLKATIESEGATMERGMCQIDAALDMSQLDPVPGTPSGPTTPTFEGLLDTYTGAAAAYSVRRLSSSYTDSLIRVRRSSDDTEQDIGFDSNGDLDTTALTTFVGSENLFFPSETFTGWGNIGGSTITSNTTETDDPFGGSNATKVVAGSSVLIYEGTFTNVVRTQTFYAKAGTCETFGMYFGSGFNATFNISADSPSVTSTNNTTATITAVGDGWYRCSATLTSLPASDYYAGVNFSPTSGTTFYIFGAQLEGGTSASEYNKTTTGIAGDGAVTTFYDQSGNGNDATNATESEQPLVVSGGTLVTENSKAAIDFDGVDDYLGLVFSLDVTLGYTNFYVCSVNNDAIKYILASVKNSSNRYAIGVNSLGDFQSTKRTASIVADAATYVSGQVLLSDNSTPEIYLDGNLGAATVATLNNAFASEFMAIGKNSTPTGINQINGVFQEIILFNSDQSSNRTGMETNINDHFDIYTP